MRHQVGDRLGDRYELLEPIAVGGMGEVWRAVDQVLGRDVAVKVLKPEYTSDPGFLDRFRAEARHTAALSHPNIAGVYDYGETTEGGRESAYLVMELVPGEPLSDELARQGRMPADRAMDLLGQAALGLAAAHAAGVVHRDVKPGNLLVTPDDTVKITDFGIARAVDDAPLTRTGTVMGTAHYLSPEQVGGHPATARSDVYALGVVAFECLSGHRPFDGATPSDVARQHLQDDPPALPTSVPSGVRALVARCLEKDPDDRPQDAAEVARVARSLQGATPGPTVEVRPRARALRLAVPLLVVALLALGLRTFVAGGGRSTEVPLVRAGSSAVEAQQLLRDTGLAVRWRTEVAPDVPEGRVVRTEPGAGERVPSDSTVEVVLSGEVLVGLPYEQARAVLERRGLRPVRRDDGEGGPAGTVSSLEPDGPLEPGSEVVVHVVPEEGDG